MRLRILLAVCSLFIVLPVAAQADEFSQLQQQILILIQQVTQLQANLNNLQRVSNLPCSTLDRNLGLGDKGEDVAFLHLSLGKEGFPVAQDEKNSRTYGESTASAISGLQQKYKDEILTPLGLSYGTGFMGKSTRAKLNSVYGCGAKAPDLSQRPLVLTPQPLQVSEPLPTQTVSGTMKVLGNILSDGWITGSGDLGFVVLYDGAGRKVSQANLTTKAKDKTILPVAFEASLPTTNPRTEYGVLVFSSNSTSSLLSNSAKEFRVPVRFSKVAVPKINILSPEPRQQLISGGSYTFVWSGASGKISLALIDNGLELSGGRSVAWQINDLQVNGQYTTVLPRGLSGSYRLYVADSSGKFGLSPMFTILPGAAGSRQIPHITGVQGPRSLQVRQSGTWSIAANDGDSSGLSFSVDWGDGTSGLPGVVGGGGTPGATFSHSYALNGSYRQVYSVTDPTGLTDQYAYDVQVGTVAAPTITSMTPNIGPAGTVVTITGTRFNPTNNIIHFGSGQLTGIRSLDTKTIQFAIQQDQFGTYDISVSNGSGRSNSLPFRVAPLPGCPNLNVAGTNQFAGCFWKWRSTSSIPGYSDEGLLAGETSPAAPGFISPVPSTATALDIDWRETTPASNFIGTDYYTARWLGRFTFAPGTYRFTAGSDDGIRVYFDDVSRLDNWIVRPYAEDTFDYTFPVQTTVTIRLDYFEQGVFARVKFGWAKVQ